MAWRNCNASIRLLDFVNARWPKRDRSSDGTIGDAAHATRSSDHNPWIKVAGTGVVRARDIDKDGIDAPWLAEELRKMGERGDPRLAGGGYIIFNKRITSPDFKGWKAYTGSNPHDKHMHVSFSQNQAGFDSNAPWVIGAPAGIPVIGGIKAAYDRIKGEAGKPKGPEVPTVDGVGRWQEFSNGAIYWHPQIDGGNAHYIKGGILEKWRKLGSELVTGYPITDEMSTPDGQGRFNHFSGGWSIYYHPRTGIFEVHGAVRNKWEQLGWERGIGYPKTDELTAPDKVGRYCQFEGGHIYHHPATGAHLVKGLIFQEWSRRGWEAGILGYPLGDEYRVPGSNPPRYEQKFQKGIIWASNGASGYSLNRV